MTARRDELTDAAADAAIEQACRLLRLPAIRDRHGEIAAAAARQQAGYKAFLTELLSMECDDRETRRKARLVREAAFPRSKRIEDFDFTANAALVNELVEAADDKTLSKVIGRYGRIDLLCLDELGYIELDRRGAELLFQVFTEREEKASIAIASNAAFSEWTSAFTDPRLCGAIVDRLTYDGHIIQTGSRSCRLRTAAARRQPAPGPSPQERTDPS